MIPRLTRTLALACAALLAATLAAPTPLMAEDRGQDSPTAAQAVESPTEGYDRDRLSREGFVAASEVRPGDQVPGGPLLFIAYLVFFALLLGYIVMLVRRERAVRADLLGLKDRIEQVEDRLAVAEEKRG